MVIDHETIAELLYVTGEVPATTVEAARAAVREYRRRHGDLTALAGDVAADYSDYGEHAEVAARRMRRLLQLAPERMELPDPLPPEALRLIGCDVDECVSGGPFGFLGRRLVCAEHMAGVLHEARDWVWDGGEAL